MPLDSPVDELINGSTSDPGKEEIQNPGSHLGRARSSPATPDRGLPKLNEIKKIKSNVDMHILVRRLISPFLLEQCTLCNGLEPQSGGLG